jgi:2-iminobutanoate/2-iminopropanoate deaminase
MTCTFAGKRDVAIAAGIDVLDFALPRTTNSKLSIERSKQMNFTSTRRTFAMRLGSALSALVFMAGAATRGMAKDSQDANSIRKLNSEGKPGGDKDIIMPVIIYNGLIYVSGQGAHDTRDQKEWTIESHTSMVMDKVKKLVEVGGGTTDTILQANVFLVKIEHWDGMHKVFSTYFPHGGPARTTVAVAALPGDSLVEINCIAAVARK